MLSARFDRVILDMYDSENSFRMYSHYWYGSKVTLRPGQVPLDTMPDSDVFKLQAQVVW